MTLEHAPSLLSFAFLLIIVIGMAGFTRSNVLDAHTMATEVKPVALPADPLSHLVFTLEYLSVTDEATMPEIFAFLNKFSVLDKGVNILNQGSPGLACLNLYLFGSGGMREAPEGTDNMHNTYGLIIPFGRSLFNPDECYPGRPKGDVVLQLDTTLPITTLDGALISVSAISLPGATPSRYMKVTQRNLSAPGATGSFDADLARGNDLLALLIGMTSFAGASEYIYGGDDFELLMDNRQEAIVSAKAPELITEMISRVPGTIRAIAAQDSLIPATHLWMDFDPTRDGQFAIDTRPATDLKLRIDYGVNEALTVSQVELVTL